MRAQLEKALDDGERLEQKWNGGHSVGLGLFAGLLCLTNLRLLFVPGMFTRKMSAWSVPRSEVIQVSVADRNWQPYNGGMRRRLFVRTAGGRDGLFTVNQVDSVAAELRAHLGLTSTDA